MECVVNVYSNQKLLQTFEIIFEGLEKLVILSHSSILTIKPLMTIKHEKANGTSSIVSIARTTSLQIRK